MWSSDEFADYLTVSEGVEEDVFRYFKRMHMNLFIYGYLFIE